MTPPTGRKPAAPLPIVTTGIAFDGYRIVKYHGVVRGIIVRSPTIVQGFLGGIMTVFGGRIGSYEKMCEQTRNAAFDHMLQQAAVLGANGIIGIGYDASEVARNAYEVLCYGTAVTIERVATA
jgi:uncharacterized protein YbjQ (UPF0145 family)